jgi:hypothetical protein
MRPGSLDDLIGKPAPRPPAAPSGLLPIILGGAALLICAVLIFFLIRGNQQQTAQNQKVQEQLSGVQKSLDLIDSRLGQTDSKIASLQSETSVMQEHMGLTEAELQRAKALAQQLQAEQQKNVRALSAQLAAKADTKKVDSLQQESAAKFEGVSQDITQVKEDVKSSREELERTKAELSRLGVIVTDQGNLIATNATALEELRRRGERDYLTFDVRKKQPASVGAIRLELRKADLKKGYADIKVYADDRGKDYDKVFLNTPLNLYVGRDPSTRVPYEIVVNELRKDEMLGYVAVPKGSGSATGNPALLR